MPLHAVALPAQFEIPRATMPSTVAAAVRMGKAHRLFHRYLLAVHIGEYDGSESITTSAHFNMEA